MHNPKLILDYVYDHEAAHPDEVVLVQPVGGGRVVEYTWRQMLDEARRMAAHLKSRDFEPGARIAILSKNCAHFFMAELAVWMAGGTSVAIFPTESSTNVRYVLEHSEASLLFVGKLDTWEQQALALPDGLPCIALPLAPQTDFETWGAIVARTEPLGGRPSRGADDLAMLLYTSGSTGQPKGVMQNFHNITRTSELRISDAHTRLPDNVERRVLSYLPLAHVYERAVVECCTFVEGRGRVFFTESLATFLEDLKRARPTAFVSVPRLWLKFQQGVFLTMPSHKLDAMLDDPAIATEVGRKVLAGLGLDEVRIAASASAPIPGELLDWYRRLGLNLLEGYGMTEDLGYSHRTTEEANLLGHVGVPFPGVQVRIAEDGEVLIKSPGQLVGYYKRADLDAASFTEDGFFRTGDLGMQRADGQLRITGRVKELFKTAKGEYVAPAPIEHRLNAHPMVELAMVSGVGQPAPYAIVVLAESLRPQLGDPAVRGRVDAELGKLLHDVNESLATFERLHVLVVAREPWSIENGCLTPTMKLKRSRVEAALAAQVGAWYAEERPVVWP
jgi:long-subunit acyl-CoA synthetase (AMP-forming)